MGEDTGQCGSGNGEEGSPAPTEDCYVFLLRAVEAGRTGALQCQERPGHWVGLSGIQVPDQQRPESNDDVCQTIEGHPVSKEKG